MKICKNNCKNAVLGIIWNTSRCSVNAFKGLNFLLTSPFCCDQLRLEALCQMSSFLSKMEEKSSAFPASPQFPALLQSVQLQFLSGCFALGTQIIGSHSGANYEMQHYMVHLVITLSQCLCRCFTKAGKKERMNI